jgi:hypothetical protein
MGNVLDKSCRENQNTHFMFNNFFSENCTVYEIMSKNWVETEGPQIMSQYGAYALYAGLTRLHAVMCIHTPTCMQGQVCTHRPISNTRIAFLQP